MVKSVAGWRVGGVEGWRSGGWRGGGVGEGLVLSKN